MRPSTSLPRIRRGETGRSSVPSTESRIATTRGSLRRRSLSAVYIKNTRCSRRSFVSGGRSGARGSAAGERCRAADRLTARLPAAALASAPISALEASTASNIALAASMRFAHALNEILTNEPLPEVRLLRRARLRPLIVQVRSDLPLRVCRILPDCTRSTRQVGSGRARAHGSVLRKPLQSVAALTDAPSTPRPRGLAACVSCSASRASAATSPLATPAAASAAVRLGGSLMGSPSDRCRYGS